MIIQVFPSGPLDTNAYLIACSETHQAAFIDPAPESARSLISFVETHHLDPSKILLTHSHWDHTVDVPILKQHYPIPVGVHALDKGNLEVPGSDGLPCWFPMEKVLPDFLFQEDDVISLGNLSFSVIHTPGHTPGGVCFYCKEEGVLFSGDTLFKGTIGNLSFSTGRPDLMWPSLAKLSLLPPNTVVYPGHGPKTTIGAEKWLSDAKKFFGDR